MLAEFEEKQYEQHLNRELLQGKKLLFPPGQVLENTLGFDAALFTTHPKFWENLLPDYRWYYKWLNNSPSGLKLPLELWQILEKDIENFPRFKCNAFIQHKRPEFMVRFDAREWDLWRSPYYRYKLIPQQQTTLSILDNRIGDKGVVVYACPVLHKMSHLWRAIENEELIKLSNFCRAKSLDTHHSFTFQQPGSYGIAHSNPEEIKNFDFISHLSQMIKKNGSESNEAHLVELGDIVTSVAYETDLLSEQFKTITDYLLPELSQLPIAKALVKIDVFRFLTRTDLFIGF